MRQVISIATLNGLRQKAVHMRLAGEPLTEICKQTGISAPTVISAHKSFLAGGWDAIAVQPRGRSAGDGRRISDAQEEELFRLMSAGGPEKHGLIFRLWQLEAVRALAMQRFGVTLSERTITSYVQRWGLSAPRPSQRIAERSELLRQWRNTIYPGILARTRTEQANIFWVDELPVCWTGAAGPLRSSVVRAVSNRGRVRWLAYAGALRAPTLIDFFDRLLASNGRKVIAILDGMQWQRAASLVGWLHERSDRLLVFHTPDAQNRVSMAHAATDPRCAVGNKALPLAIDGKSASFFSLQLRLLAAQLSPSQAHYTVPSPPRRGNGTMSLTNLQRLEAESIHVMREVVAEAENPVMLYSMGKDSAVMLHLAMKAFYPSKPPFPMLHVDTTWKFQEMYAFRDMMAEKLGFDLLVHINPEGLEKNINPFTHGSAIHTDVMKTEALKQALDKYGFDAAFGGARRDEEKSRAKERIFSFRSGQHRWDPKNQRPELWHIYNARKHKGESMRVFPLSNWTELDVWQYIYLQNIPIVPLYFAKERPVVERDGSLIMVDDERMPLHEGEVPMLRKVRFRTLGCYPLTGAVESEADSLPKIIQEMLLCKSSERQGRVIDHDSAGSMEKKKQEGYF